MFSYAVADKVLTKDSPSMAIIGGIMADTFLIVFLRNLFSEVGEWPPFITFAAVLGVLEAGTYQFTITEKYEKLHDYFIDIAKANLEKSEQAMQMLFSIMILVKGKEIGEI